MSEGRGNDVVPQCLSHSDFQFHMYNVYYMSNKTYNKIMIRITNSNQAKDIRVCLFTRTNGLATETKLQRGGNRPNACVHGLINV